MRNRSRRLCWLIALGITAAMFLLIALRLDWRYCQNDDIAILRSFMGYETGEPASFHIFIHGLLAWPMYWLALAFPTVAWFSVFQIALLCLSVWMCAKGLMQCFVNAGRPLWLGTAAAVAFSCLCLEVCTRITFTQTAAMLGAAAVMQILSLDREQGTPRQAALGVVAALPPVAFAYALRKEALWPILAFAGLALLVSWLLGSGENRRARSRAMLLAGAACLVVIAGLMGWRTAEVSASGQEDYLAWQEARSQLLDYYALSEVPKDAFEAVGWTDGTVQRANAYFFLDTDISTESLQSLLAACEEAGGRTPDAQAALRTLQTAVRGSLSFSWVFCIAAGLWALGVMLACVRAEIRPRLLAALLGGALLLAVVLGYLALEGRLPTRVLWLAFLPFAAFAAGLFPACLPACWTQRARTGLCAVLVAVQLCVCGWMLADLVPALLPDAEAAAEVGDPAAALDEYALWNPDMLFIHDLTLAVDTRLFPDVSEGIPHNVVCWGGWNLRSPATVEQFAAFGIDLLNFDPSDLLRYDVCIASGVVDPPPTLVIDYLREKVDPACDYMIYSEMGGVYFFQFY